MCWGGRSMGTLFFLVNCSMNLKLLWKKKCLLKKTKYILKIKSRVLGWSLDSRFPFCMMRLEEPHCSNMRHQDFSTQPTKNNLREWLGFFLPNLVYTGLGPKQSGLKPSSARRAVVLIYVDWMRSHMSKSFVNCQTHMNINCYCWIIYKCNLKCFKCVRVAYHACPHHASHWSAPDFEKALMGRPRSHASKIASSKQGQAVKKESSSHSCLLWVQPAMQGKESYTHTLRI